MSTLKEEDPFVAVVSEDCLCNTCSFCFAHLVRILKCKNCLFVGYCSKECQVNDWTNHKIECQLLQRWKRDSPARQIPNAEVRLTARILTKTQDQLAQRAFNGRTWSSLEDHIVYEEGSCDDPAYAQRQLEVNFLQYFLDPLRKFGEKRLWHELGKVKTNYLEISDNLVGSTTIGIGIYLGLSVHDNSCIPDSWIVFTGKTASLRTFGEDDYYSSVLTFSRNSRTSSNKNRPGFYKKRFIQCHCDLCNDPELLLNQMAVSIRSSCCPTGAGCPFNEDGFIYSCYNCGTIVPADLEKVREMHEELNHLSKTIVFDNDKKMLLNGLRQMQKALEILSPINNELFDFCRILLEESMKMKLYKLSKGLLSLLLVYAKHYFHDGYMLNTHLLMTRSYIKFNEKDGNDDFDHMRAYSSLLITYGSGHPITKRFREAMNNYPRPLPSQPSDH